MSSLLEDIILYKKEYIKSIRIENKRTRKIHKFKHYIKKDRINIIAEIKSSSPSAGFIKDVDLNEIVPFYAKFACSISVLTDKKFFGGSFERLKEVADRVDMPILCKDFIIDEVQIDKAYECGADMVLLIARLLDNDEFARLYSYAKGLGLDVLSEVHTKDEADFVSSYGCDIIGVNSRNLDTLEISLSRCLDILNSLKNGAIKIAESGIRTKKDIEYLKESCDAFLIGEALLQGSIKFSEVTYED